ncbi:hypothetical protein [Nocardia pneumoniae]|uniref:hypothetical protein n=1 Tax=Nocardia pneumoniae TaxID=228601 RepID=UPI00030F1125|nr:hypothetical protein [Nocardia pneumoniae]
MTQKDNDLPTGPPAPEPLPMPNNPWPELKKRADQAKDPLKFEQQAAVDLATATANTITNMRLMRRNAETVINLTDFAPPPLVSGAALAKKFSGRGEEMRRIIEAHLDILQDMMDTIIAAGKNYDAGEQDNEALFDNISPTFKAPVFPGDSKTPRFDWKSEKSFKDGHPVIGDVPKSLRSRAIEFLPSSIWAESKKQSWHTLYSLGQHIKNNYVAEILADAAGEWDFMGRKVQEYFSELLNRVDSVTAEQWTGTGAATAVAAIKNYADGIKPLQESLFQVRDIIRYTARWLDAQAGATPTEATNPAEKDPKADDWLPYYQNMFGDIYVKGMEQSATHVPNLVYPAASFKGVPPLPGTKPAGGGKGKPESGSGTQTGPGPGVTRPGPGPGPGYSLASSPGPGPGYAQTQESQRQERLQRQADVAARKQQQEALAFQREQQADARRQQAEAAKYQRQQQAEAKRQQEQQAADQAAQQSQQAMQQAMQAGQQAVQQAAQAAQQAAQEAAQKELASKQLAGLPGLPGLDPATGLPKGAAGPGPGPGLASSPLAKDLVQASKLFPRADAAVTAAGTAAGRAGMAPMAGTPGSPGSPGAAGRGAGGEAGNQHKRLAGLQSSEHLEEALGDAPRVVKPVVEK